MQLTSTSLVNVYFFSLVLLERANVGAGAPMFGSGAIVSRVTGAFRYQEKPAEPAETPAKPVREEFWEPEWVRDPARPNHSPLNPPYGRFPPPVPPARTPERTPARIPSRGEEHETSDMFFTPWSTPARSPLHGNSHGHSEIELASPEQERPGPSRSHSAGRFEYSPLGTSPRDHAETPSGAAQEAAEKKKSGTIKKVIAGAVTLSLMSVAATAIACQHSPDSKYGRSQYCNITNGSSEHRKNNPYSLNPAPPPPGDKPPPPATPPPGDKPKSP